MIDAIRALYTSMPERLARARREWNRPLTLSEKILVGHVHDWTAQAWERGKATLRLRVDRVAMQDATGQMALLQFMQAGKAAGGGAVDGALRPPDPRARRAPPRTCSARSPRTTRSTTSSTRPRRSTASASGSRASGIIHQVVLENYAFPGGLMIGADSHTPNARRPRHAGHRRGRRRLRRGDGRAALGGARTRSSIGVHLTGKLSGWTSPKDVITYLCGLLTVKGGTNKIIEYFGPGAESISATGKGTICNMGAELGATTSLFPFDDADGRVPARHRARRHRRAGRASTAQHLVRRSRGAARSRGSSTTRSSRSTSPRSSRTSSARTRRTAARPISKLAAEVQDEQAGRPRSRDALIGSCTNSSYEDMRRAAHVAMQGAQGRAQGARRPFLVTPGSERIYQTIKRDGHHGDVREDRAAPCSPTRAARASASGSAPTSGQDETNTIVSSFNRNFPGRNDGSAATLSFLTSPEIVTALAFAGTLEFDPVHGTHDRAGRQGVPLHAARGARSCPREGFARGEEGYEAPAADGDAVAGRRPPEQRAAPAAPALPALGRARTSIELPILVKTKGKTTTDHISPAGRVAPLPRPPRQDQRQHVPGRASTPSPARRARASNPVTGEAGKTVHRDRARPRRRGA